MIRDTLNLTTRTITDEGYLRAVATITCVGVQEYYGSELEGMVDSELTSTNIYKVFRSPKTVFNDLTIESAKLKPITDEHPNMDVNSDNYKYISIGNTGESAQNINNDALAFSIVITDKEGVNKIESGTHQLSSGYTATLKLQEGMYNDQKYDLIFDGGMKINHIALVKEGRCGNGARILDNHKETNMFKKKSKNIKDIKDIDMSSLLNIVAEKLLPDVQKLIESDDFTNKLATVVGNNLSSNAQENEDIPEDGDVNAAADQDVPSEVDATDMDPASEEETSTINDPGQHDEDKDIIGDSKKINRKKFNKTINDRLNVIRTIEKLSPKIHIGNKTNQELLLECMSSVTDRKLDNKDVGYLKALADIEIERRSDANDYLSDASTDNSHIAIPKNSLELHKAIHNMRGNK